MKFNELPKATSVDLVNGKLFYCDDGITLKTLAANLLASQDNSNNEEEEEE